MNKIVVLLLCLFLGIPVWGQQLMRVPRFFDNWSITAMGGIYHPLAYSPNGDLVSAVYGVELKKQFSPVLGLAAEYNYFAKNTLLTESKAERPQVHLLSTFNLMNLFGGYRGRSRVFEIDLKWGLGAGSYTETINGTQQKGDYLVSKVGADFNFNLGRHRVWTLTLRPAVVFDLRAKGTHQAAYNANQADVQLMGGLTYHFRNHDKRRNFTLGSSLALGSVVEERKAENKMFSSDALQGGTTTTKRIVVLEKTHDSEGGTPIIDTIAVMTPPVSSVGQLDASVAHKDTLPIQSADTLSPHQHTWKMEIAFEEGSAKVSEAQFFNVERVAYILQHRPNAKVVVQGYAMSNELGKSRNDLAVQRARVVKILLVAQYNIASSRIHVSEQGMSREFSVSEWPSVAICSVTDPD